MKKLLPILFVSLSIAACNKQIDEIKPLTKVDAEGELSSVSGIVEATVGNYSLLSGSGFFSYSVPTLNIGESRGNNVALQEFLPVNQKTDAFFFQNNNGPTLGYSSDFYRGSYQLIVSINTVLEGIARFEENGYASLADADKNAFLYAKGENLFLRAFTYFNLVRIYGKPYYQGGAGSSGVPLKITSDVSDEPAPSTVKEVYDFVVAELKTAAQLMKAPVVKKNSFANHAAAWALLSRVYLYMGGSVAAPDNTYNEAAVTYADSVIAETGGKYELLQGAAYTNMFGDDEFGDLGRSVFATNKEIIWAFDNGQGGSSVGELFHYDAQYNVGALFLPSADFKAQIAPGDVRGNLFKLNPNSGFVETTKYLCLNQAWLTSAPIIYFRMGEVYLNRAEAYAKLGNYAMAKADLKAIHTRAGLPAADIDNLANQDVLNEVLKERRIELAFEGHASYDYFRNGLPMTRIAVDNGGQSFTIQPDDPKVVFTIPNL
jgi:starch-binding outer membrane protein, SusD/RagB family